MVLPNLTRISEFEVARATLRISERPGPSPPTPVFGVYKLTSATRNFHKLTSATRAANIEDSRYFRFWICDF